MNYGVLNRWGAYRLPASSPAIVGGHHFGEGGREAWRVSHLPTDGHCKWCHEPAAAAFLSLPVAQNGLIEMRGEVTGSPRGFLLPPKQASEALLSLRVLVNPRPLLCAFRSRYFPVCTAATPTRNSPRLISHLAHIVRQEQPESPGHNGFTGRAHPALEEDW